MTAEADDTPHDETGAPATTTLLNDAGTERMISARPLTRPNPRCAISASS
jgi:hypothetical protein